MSTIFWAGLAAGAILSFVASVVANIFNAKIGEFIDQRKLASQSSRYAKAKAFHRLIVELHTGVRDKYLYLNRLSIRITIGAIAAFSNLAVMGGVLALMPQPPEGWPNLLDHRDRNILTLFFSALVFYVYASATSRYRKITNALDSFEEFDAQFQQRWAPHSPNTATSK
jgi:hypothetical protein